MLKTRFTFKSIALGLILSAHSLFAGPGGVTESTQGETVDISAIPSPLDTRPHVPEVKGKDPKELKLLRAVDWPAPQTELEGDAPFSPVATRLVYTHVSDHSLGIPAKTTAAFIIFGGTGASRATKGIEASMTSPMAAITRSRAHAFALENPLYFGAGADYGNDLNHEREFKFREPYLERFSLKEAQLTWFYSVVNYLAQFIPADVPIILYGRSTGSGVIAQAFHERARHIKRAAIMKRVKVCYLTGMVGHLPPDIRSWYWMEFLGRLAKPESKDFWVAQAGPRFFKDFDFATPGLAHSNGFKEEELPRMVITIGARDGFFNYEDQIRVANTFAENNPQARFELRFGDFDHDPAWPGSYEYRDPVSGNLATMSFTPMERLKFHLSYLVNGVRQPQKWTNEHTNYFDRKLDGERLTSAPNIIEVKEKGWTLSTTLNPVDRCTALMANRAGAPGDEERFNDELRELGVPAP